MEWNGNELLSMIMLIIVMVSIMMINEHGEVDGYTKKR